MADRNQHELENGRPKAPRPVNELEADPPTQIQSPYSVQADSKGGAQLLHIELGLGKSALIILWLAAFISSVAIVGLIANYSAYKTVSAQYQILQYDHQALKAQLVARGIYEGTEH